MTKRIFSLLAFLLLASTAWAGNRITLTILVTNAPAALTNGVYAINGQYRYWSNTVGTANLIQITNSVQDAATNIYNNAVANTYGAGLVYSISSNQFKITGGDGVALSGTITGAWGVLSYATNVTLNTYGLQGPGSNMAPALATNEYQQAVNDLQAYGGLIVGGGGSSRWNINQSYVMNASNIDIEASGGVVASGVNSGGVFRLTLTNDNTLINSWVGNFTSNNFSTLTQSAYISNTVLVLSNTLAGADTVISNLASSAYNLAGNAAPIFNAGVGIGLVAQTTNQGVRSVSSTDTTKLNIGANNGSNVAFTIASGVMVDGDTGRTLNRTILGNTTVFDTQGSPIIDSNRNDGSAAISTLAAGVLTLSNATLNATENGTFTGTITPTALAANGVQLSAWAASNGFYVASWGSDTNAGTVNAPFLTVARGLNALMSSTSTQWVYKLTITGTPNTLTNQTFTFNGVTLPWVTNNPPGAGNILIPNPVSAISAATNLIAALISNNVCPTCYYTNTTATPKPVYIMQATNGPLPSIGTDYRTWGGLIVSNVFPMVGTTNFGVNVAAGRVVWGLIILNTVLPTNDWLTGKNSGETFISYDDAISGSASGFSALTTTLSNYVGGFSITVTNSTGGNAANQPFGLGADGTYSDIRGTAIYDFFYGLISGATNTFRSCSVTTQFDTLVNLGLAFLYDCQFRAVSYTNHIAQGVSNNSATSETRAKSCDFFASSSLPAQIADGAYVSLGTLTAYGCSFSSTNTGGGASSNLVIGAGAVVNLYGCNYDQTLVNGTIANQGKNYNVMLTNVATQVMTLYYTNGLLVGTSQP